MQLVLEEEPPYTMNQSQAMQITSKYKSFFGLYAINYFI